jgi:hypothetical protein
MFSSQMIKLHCISDKRDEAVSTLLAQLVPLVVQELITLPEHLSSPLVFSGVCVAQSLVFCVVFVDHRLSFCNHNICSCLNFVTLRQDRCCFPSINNCKKKFEDTNVESSNQKLGIEGQRTQWSLEKIQKDKR